MIYIVEDSAEFAECIALACCGGGGGLATGNGSAGTDAGPADVQRVRIFANAIEAMQAMNEELPELIFLDVLLDGPDGFTFLNELASYADTARIPVVIVSSLDFSGKDLSDYGVVGYLDKAKMTPADVREYVKKYVKTPFLTQSLAAEVGGTGVAK